MVTRRKALAITGAAVGGVAVAGTGAVVLANRDKPEPPSPAAVDGQGRMLWRNWSGIQNAYPAARLAPKDEGALAAGLKAAIGPIRAVGAGHSFTALAATSGTLVSLDAMAGVTGWDGDVAMVRAGTRLGALGPALAVKGRAMANLPDINKQSLAGAMATATHGTGQGLKALHGDVVGLTLVTAEGETRRMRRRPAAGGVPGCQGLAGGAGHCHPGAAGHRRQPAGPPPRLGWEPFEETLGRAEERWRNASQL